MVSVVGKPQLNYILSKFLLIVNEVKGFGTTNKNVSLVYPVLLYIGNVIFGVMDNVGKMSSEQQINFCGYNNILTNINGQYIT
jgi:hypothetical protein